MQGFGRVCNIPGSWQAWKNAGYPVDKEIQKEKK
jgi:hydroxyacylglutathione hydrolase